MDWLVLVGILNIDVVILLQQNCKHNSAWVEACKVQGGDTVVGSFLSDRSSVVLFGQLVQL